MFQNGRRSPTDSTAGLADVGRLDLRHADLPNAGRDHLSAGRHLSWKGTAVFNVENADALSKEIFSHPLAICVALIPIQLFLAGISIGAAAFSREGMRQRLRLTKGHWSWTRMVLVGLATPFIGLLTSLVMDLFWTSSGSLQDMVDGMRAQHASGYLPLLYFVIGFCPGVCEELFFRGYVQQGFLRRWSPVWAVGFTSFCFAAFHLDPVHVVAVLPVGIWLGVSAWKSGSLWTSIVGHIANNVMSVAGTVYATGDIFDLPPWSQTIGITVFGLLGIVLLFQASPRTLAENRDTL